MTEPKHFTPPQSGGGAQRIAGLDIIRCFAILFVVGSHFFMYSGFNDATFSSLPMFGLGMLQTLTMANVPLFLMLTGYLNLNKTVGRKFYKGAIRVLVSYLLFSVITIFYRHYYLHEDTGAVKSVLMILNFTEIPYAWYIEMWIGLFLLTPFFNILWKNIPTRREKIILIVTLYLLTALPDFFNRYGVRLVPGYWEALFPATFYFAGAYVREYQPRIKARTLLAIIFGICLINPTINILLFSHRPMLHLIGDGNGIFMVPLTILFFILFYKRDIRSMTVKKVVTEVSLVSLDTYLVSWMFDSAIYPLAKQYMPSMHSFGIWVYYLAVVGTVFTLSTLAAILKQQIFKLIRLGKIA